MSQDHDDDGIGSPRAPSVMLANLPTLSVLAAVLFIDPDDPDDAEDLEAAAWLLARRVLRGMRDEPPPDRPRLRMVE